MKAMILAAGFGTRMGELTRRTPKPLLVIRGKPLIVWHLEALAQVGVQDVVINVSYLGEQIREYIGSGETWGLNVCYSSEGEPLETGGAIYHALLQNLLGDDPFMLINADVYTDYPYVHLTRGVMAEQAQGHLVLVPNPDFKNAGDFSLDYDNRLCLASGLYPDYTFSGISLIRPSLILEYPRRRRRFTLAEAFRYAIRTRALTGERYDGVWSDIGTPARLGSFFQSDV